MSDVTYKFDNRIFEPTVSILKNALLINYKKVGTRYFNQLSSFPNDVDTYRKQIDLQIIDRLHIDTSEHIHEYSKINYRFGNSYHVITPFDLNKYFHYDNDLSFFGDFNTSLEFLNYLNCSSYNELFFENKDRDIVFIIRNPLKRILTGISQIITVNTGMLYNDIGLRNELKFYTKLEDSNIENVMKYCNLSDSDLYSKLEIDSVFKIFEFITFKKWDWILEDIHTENYLQNYIEWIHNVKDKSRVKVIDLEHCRSKKSFEFFSNLRGDSELTKVWEEFDRYQESNKLLYNKFLELFQFKNFKSNQDDIKNPITNYLRNEFKMYEALINSPYYLDLKD